MTSLIISGTAIRQDSAGRYCLNDLHAAAGSVGHHRPSKWLATKQAQALVDEVNLEARIRASNSVRGHGITATYVVKELVYAYAMWISPAFHLKVIRTYDAVVRGELDAGRGRLLEAGNRLVRMERAYFARYPRDKEIQRLAMLGEPYWYIARRVACHTGTVSRSVKRMVVWSIIDAERLARAREGMARHWRQRRLHANQLPLSF